MTPLAASKQICCACILRCRPDMMFVASLKLSQPLQQSQPAHLLPPTLTDVQGVQFVCQSTPHNGCIMPVRLEGLLAGGLWRPLHELLGCGLGWDWSSMACLRGPMMHNVHRRRSFGIGDLLGPDFCDLGSKQSLVWA